MRADFSTRRDTSSMPLASVRPDWADWHVAHVPVVELMDVHWDRAPSASRVTSGECVLYAFMRSDAAVAGEWPDANECAGRRTVRVCLLREDNERHVFDRLILEAGPRPRELPVSRKRQLSAA